jgi:hypothetical protein
MPILIFCQFANFENQSLEAGLQEKDDLLTIQLEKKIGHIWSSDAQRLHNGSFRELQFGSS